MNFDHLTNLPDKLEGVVVSVKPLPNGFSFIIKPDAAAFGDRRYVGHSAEVSPQGTDVKPGIQVAFLPGSPRKPGMMPRAYEISIVQRRDE